MRISRAGSIGVAFIVTAAAVGTVCAAQLSDIAQDPNKTAITALASRGIISGYPNPSGSGQALFFKPNNTMNRAEFAKVLVASMGVTPLLSDYHDCFSDVTTQWFAPAVCYAKEHGWITGYPDPSASSGQAPLFKPAHSVSTVEAIKMIVTAEGYVPLQSVAHTDYADVLIGAWYVPYVLAAEDAGMITDATRTLGVADPLTRGAISAMIYHCMQVRVAAENVHAAASGSESPTAWDAFVASVHRSAGGNGNGGGGGTTTTATSSANNVASSDVSNTSSDVPSASSSASSVVSSSSSSSVSSTSSSVSSASSSIALTTPTMTLNDISKNYGDVPFILAPTSNSNGTFTFLSSNTAVATISGHTATIVGSGSTTITVNQAASGSYATGSTTATLTVHAIAPTLSLGNISKNYGDAPFTLSPTSNSSGAFSYVSSNTSVATMSGNTVRVVGSGSTTITVTQVANGNYLRATTTATLTVHAIAPSITFADLSVGYGTGVVLAPTSNSNGAFTYLSGNTGIATISGNVLTPVALGTTTVTAQQTASGGYTSGTKIAALTVHIGTPIITFNDISKTSQSAPFSLSLLSNSNGALIFLSSNTSIATISGTTVTILAGGGVTITAHQASTALFTGATVTATLSIIAVDMCASFPCGIHGTCTRESINPGGPLDSYSCSCNSGYGGTDCNLLTPTIGAFTGVTKQMGDLPFTLIAPHSNSNGAFTFTSSNTGVVMISGNTATIIPDDSVMTHTSVTITAHQDASDSYTSGTQTMTLTVVQGECSTEPCENGGSCTDEPSDTFSCSCVGIYSGTLCELNDSSCNYDHGNEYTVDCKNGGSCIPDLFGGYCQCVEPFTGSNCQDLDPDFEAFRFDPQNLMCMVTEKKV